MFTVMFAIGRMPGWIANWKEVWEGQSRIYRPRQVYVGPVLRDYVPVSQRKLIPIPGMSGEVAMSGGCK
jgi:citrate synthase